MAEVLSRVTKSGFYSALLIYLIVQLVHHVHLNSTTTGVSSFWNLLNIIVEVGFSVFVANSLYGTASGKIGKIN
jgi:hypothetical protein